jgi:hypothetical protein
MDKSLTDLKTNLLMGLRMALFRPCETSDFKIGSDQLVLLLVVDLLLNIGLGLFFAPPGSTFVAYALPTYSFDIFVSFLLVFLIAKLWKKPDLFLTVNVVLLSLAPITNALNYADRYPETGATDIDAYHGWWLLVLVIYNLAMVWRASYIASGRLKAIAAAIMLSFIISSGLQTRYFGDYQEFWSLAEQEEIAEQDLLDEYRTMDAEALMYRQPEMLESALQNLQPQHKYKSELFFIGFASYATEDVFSKEVNFAKDLLDQRFDTKGHSINLINHLATRETVPLANATNLGLTLKRIGQLMNRDEDVLVLYLTSHGSEDHTLSVSFWPLQLNDITPEKLRAMLDDAGIKWRVVIVSACYSGGFVEALKSDETLVATAAAADKTSFGCGTESEFTYFGEALFKDQLPNDYSFVSALQQTRIEIAEREKREDIEASLPQLSVGDAIKTKLESLSAEMRGRQCDSAARSPVC